MEHREQTCDPDELLDPGGAAKILGISVRQVYNLLKAGSIESLKIGVSRRIRRIDLRAFILRQLAAGSVA